MHPGRPHEGIGVEDMLVPIEAVGAGHGVNAGHLPQDHTADLVGAECRHRVGLQRLDHSDILEDRAGHAACCESSGPRVASGRFA